MIKFFIEPGYDVKTPERANGNGGIDFFIPKHTDTFVKAFNEKNAAGNAILDFNEVGEPIIKIMPHGRVNIPSGIRSFISPNVALEAHNKSGIATKYGLVFGASTVDANYQGIIHISLINTTKHSVDIPLGMKVVQFIPRLIDTSAIEVYNDISFEEFYKDFEFSNRGEGAFGSTGV
jgi:deoxyuridine 5'-triphosphate nucleotidohydrolase